MHIYIYIYVISNSYRTISSPGDHPPQRGPHLDGAALFRDAASDHGHAGGVDGAPRGARKVMGMPCIVGV